MRFLKRLVAAERPRRSDPVLRDLIEDYNAELRLAKQLRDHAAKAPYPHAEKRLRELAAAEEAQAARLREAIEALGGSAPDVQPAVRDGKNHWARLMIDLEEKRAIGARYQEQAMQWETGHPQVAGLLRSLEREEEAHQNLLRDMAARSDPHALN